MKIVCSIFVTIVCLKTIVYSKSDLSGFEFQGPVDYNTACGEPFGEEFPWLVTINKIKQVRFTTTKSFSCIGNIIDKHTIVTVAHCVKFGDTILQGNEVVIDVGKTSFSGRTINTKEYSIREIIVHPNFVWLEPKYNIAILKTDKPIQFSSYVHPICLTDDMSKFNKSQSGVASAFTYLVENRTDDVLKIVYLPIIYDNAVCMEDPVYNKLLTQNNFCAGSPTLESHLCPGSSGTSLSLIEETLTKFIWYFKGMVVYGQSCASGFIVFLDIFKFVDWINENKS